MLAERIIKMMEGCLSQSTFPWE